MIEVARTSLAKDRGVKASLYARFGIPEYWIVDVEGRLVEVRRDPNAATGSYGTLDSIATGSIVCLSVPGLTVPLDILFG